MTTTSTSYSPLRSSPASSRLQLGGASRLRSSSLKKPPEPLRRAVADSLSSSAPSHHGSPSSGASEASKILRDYLAAHATTDLAYNVILEHTLAEKERSPAVVGRCVALLKRHLLRYKPSEETLLQIDRFCVNIIAECDIFSGRRSSAWSQSSTSLFGKATSTSPLPVSSFASGALVKSLNYVRSLVAQHMPRRSFQPAAFAGVPSSRQSLPTLSSLLSRSFNSQLTPANNSENSENKETTTSSVSSLQIAEKVNRTDDLEFIAVDVLKWRWCRDQQSSSLSSESDHSPSPQDTSTHNFLEVGAAALLVGDMEYKSEGQPWRNFGTSDMPYLDQLLQPSLLTTVTSSASARAHLRAITAAKRTKTDPNKIWEESQVSTFRPRARPLFQYRPYSEQQPLRLNPAEVCEVIASVCTESPPPNAIHMTVSSKLSNNSGKPSMDVAVSVLIKLVIDMYILDSGTAAPLTLSMLKEMLTSPKLTSRSRAFDLILNLGVHGHLLEPMILDNTTTIEEDYPQESYLSSEEQLAIEEKRLYDYSSKLEGSPAISKYETWILGILYEILLHLVQIQEKDESVWASALSCLLYFVCDRGNIRRNKLEGLDIRVVKVLIEISRRNSWAEIVHSKLICMLTNMFYHVHDTTVSAIPMFLIEQVDLIGGIDFIFMELVLSKSREERRNLYLVLFDYVSHLINEICVANGISEYGHDEIQPIATSLVLADAPEAFYISVKLGVEGIGELLKRSISAALSTYPNSDRLNTLLEKITEKLDTFISSFIHLDKEFAQMIQITKSLKSMESINGGVARHSVNIKVAWPTLHSLLHSERLVCRQNGYVWLGDLLIAEINEEGGANTWSNIKSLQQKVALAGINDYSVDLDVPLPVWLMCGLLKSKNSIIRWGFLFVLERLLMRCKFLLDENDLQLSSNSEAAGDLPDNNRLEKANAVIDIMSCALSLVAQINETDRINILKMCDILFSQLCLKVNPATSMPFGEAMRGRKVFKRMDGKKKSDIREFNQQDDFFWEEPKDDMNSRFCHTDGTPICETASMAALLLRGQAIVPMQLVARVPAALFYWPLIQLAGAATDNIALGVSVGSKGRGNLPGAASDIRATLLLLLIGKCTADPASFQEVGGEEFFRELLDDTDSRVAYYSSTFLLKRMMTEEPEKYQRMLQSLIFRAQQSNNEKLLENPYLQMRGILHLSNE